MTISIGLTVVLAVGVGFSLGLLGGGGSILAVPLLVYVAGLPAKEAIAMSLLVVGTTSAAGLVPYARAGRVRWRTGLMFGGSAMGGAYGGGRLAAVIPATVLLIGFAVMMFATAIAMIRGRRLRDDRPPAGDLPVARVVAVGLLVGSVAGLVGAGGGFLVVPALALLGGQAMPAAVATSLLVIAMQSLAGFTGHLAATTIHWGLAAAVTAAAVVGALIGARLSGRVRPEALRRAFGWFVMATASLVSLQQVPVHQRTSPLLWTGIAASVTTVALVTVRRRRMRLRSAKPGGSTTSVGDQYPRAYHGPRTATKGR